MLRAPPTPEPLPLVHGAEVRVTGDMGALAVVCVDGGASAELPGTWSASIEHLVRRLAPRFADLAFLEVRYRIKSWKRFPMCVEDARDAVSLATGGGARRVLVLGYSMGGAVAISAADDPAVAVVVGLAPWIPDRLELSPLRGRRLAVVHGSLDRAFPGVPGVSPSSSRRGYERARAEGVEATYRVIPGATHAIALRAPWGGTLPAPRARRWVELVAADLARFRDA